MIGLFCSEFGAMFIFFISFQPRVGRYVETKQFSPDILCLDYATRLINNKVGIRIDWQ